jgi:hypothetical protein
MAVKMNIGDKELDGERLCGWWTVYDEKELDGDYAVGGNLMTQKMNLMDTLRLVGKLWRKRTWMLIINISSVVLMSITNVSSIVLMSITNVSSVVLMSITNVSSGVLMSITNVSSVVLSVDI